MRETEVGTKVRLIVRLEPALVRALKVRAATEGASVSRLVGEWVRSWAALGADRRRRPS